MIRAAVATLQRVNMDTSWLLTLGTDDDDHDAPPRAGPDAAPPPPPRILLDPWLVGAEVDGVDWFNRQVHAVAPLPIAELGRIDAIVVSQPFSDHCHEETLRLLDPALPIYAVPGALGRLRHPSAGLTSRTLVPIPTYPESVALPQRGSSLASPVQVSHLPASRWHLDLLHNALLFFPGTAEATTRNAQRPATVLYAPHGYIWRHGEPRKPDPLPFAVTVPALPPIDILMCTLAEYRLPFFLGGTINLGLEAACALAAACAPRVIVDTHSEQKPATGLVPRIAATVYPDRTTAERAFQVVDAPGPDAPAAATAGPHVRHLDSYAPCALVIADRAAD